MAPLPRPFYISLFLIVILSLALLSLPNSSFSPTSYLSSFLSNTSSHHSTFAHDPAGMLSYRSHLELTTSPGSQITHSRTLGFDRIYVLSLPGRKDRREQMELLARALGVEIEFVDAALKSEPFIAWISERVAEVRLAKAKLMAAAQNVRPARIGGSISWLSPTLAPNSSTPFPPYPLDWVSLLESHFTNSTLHLLTPSPAFLASNTSIAELLRDPRERVAKRQVNEGLISTFWGHSRDDVDVEWDLERMWSRISRKLPADWDSVHLGHCWGHEILRPAYLHPLLRESTAPMCLHAYAISSHGASTLLPLLSSPWTSYQSAIDVLIPFLLSHHLLKAFSIQPPLVIQRKDGPSDLQGRNGSTWRGNLRDSTVERLERERGEVGRERTWEIARMDPGGRFREEEIGCEVPVE